MPLYRTTYTCYPRHDERWEAGSYHELAEDVAIGLNLIYAGLLEPLDGSPMPVPQDSAACTTAIQAAQRQVVHAQRPTTSSEHQAVSGPPVLTSEYVGPETRPRRF